MAVGFRACGTPSLIGFPRRPTTLQAERPVPQKNAPWAPREPRARFYFRVSYCPTSRITNDPAIGVGRGRGLSGVGAAAGLKSAVSV